MSAYIVDRAHIDAIVETAVAWRIPTPGNHGTRMGRFTDDASELGRLLWVENHKSVSYRYAEPADAISEAMDYTFTHHMRRIVLTPVQAIKAAQCLEYQSCEHPGWATSEAKFFLDQFKAEAVSRLPGYEDADWEITSAARA